MIRYVKQQCIYLKLFFIIIEKSKFKNFFLKKIVILIV